MAFTFISGLSESKLFPTKESLKRHKMQDVADMGYLYFCALRILLEVDETKAFARQYCKRTIEWGTFDKWRNDATDMFVILHAIRGYTDDDDWSGYPINRELIVSWLRDEAHDRSRASNTKRLFQRLDFDFKVREESMRSIRRLVQDWPDLDKHKKKLAMTRLLQMFRHRMHKSELLPYLDRAARIQDLEMDDVQNLEENASAGATSSASVATSVGGLGAGFDPNGDWGIYQSKKKKKKEKVLVLRR